MTRTNNHACLPSLNASGRRAIARGGCWQSHTSSSPFRLGHAAGVDRLRIDERRTSWPMQVARTLHAPFFAVHKTRSTSTCLQRATSTTGSEWARLARGLKTDNPMRPGGRRDAVERDGASRMVGASCTDATSSRLSGGHSSSCVRFVRWGSLGRRLALQCTFIRT